MCKRDEDHDHVQRHVGNLWKYMYMCMLRYTGEICMVWSACVELTLIYILLCMIGWPHIFLAVMSCFHFALPSAAFLFCFVPDLMPYSHLVEGISAQLLKPNLA